MGPRLAIALLLLAGCVQPTSVPQDPAEGTSPASGESLQGPGVRTVVGTPIPRDPGPDLPPSSPAPATAPPFPEAVEAPMGSCEAGPSSPSGASADQRIGRLIDLERRYRTTYIADCGLLQAWAAYLREPNFSALTDEAALMAGQYARLAHEYGWNQRFLKGPLQAPVTERLDPVIAQWGSIRHAWLDGDLTSVDGDQTLPAFVVATIHVAEADLEAYAADGNLTWVAHAAKAFRDAEARANDAHHLYALRVHRGRLFEVVPDNIQDGVSPEQDHVYTLLNPVGVRLHPRWNSIFEDHLLEAGMRFALATDLERVTGTNATYHFPGSAARWVTSTVPYCLSASASSLYGAAWAEAIESWNRAMQGVARLEATLDCASDRAIRGDLHDGHGHADPVRGPDGLYRGCSLFLPATPSPEPQGDVAHEIGHCLGLPHSPFVDDLMTYGRVVQTPSPRDVTTLTLQWNAPTLVVTIRTLSDIEARLRSSGPTPVSVNATIGQAPGTNVSQLFVDLDGDASPDLTASPGATLQWSYPSSGLNGIGVSSDAAFRGPSTIWYDIHS